MFIRTQKHYGASLVNIDHTTKISICEGKRIPVFDVVAYFFYNKYEDTAGLDEVLGTYTTPEQANEAMQHIMQALEANCKICLMPEDERAK